MQARSTTRPTDSRIKPHVSGRGGVSLSVPVRVRAAPLPPFEAVVSEHGAVVMRVCRAILGRVDADDAWSETFLAALKAYPTLRPDSNVRGWLVTIAHRKAIDQLRATARRARPTADVPDVATRDGDPDPPDTTLWNALAALPFKQRSAIAYHHLAGLPYAEIGALLDTSAEAVRRSAADGIANLRKAYTRETEAS
jgi:RNA polymerase sigma factor (sigma-70 family)